MKIERDFLQRPKTERIWIRKNTWCERCESSDSGMLEPKEYEADGEVFVEGKGKVCGTIIRSSIIQRG